MPPPDQTMTELDRWVFGALTLISIALIVAAGLGDDPDLFLGYLAGPGFLGFLYFMFRS